MANDFAIGTYYNTPYLELQALTLSQVKCDSEGKGGCMAEPMLLMIDELSLGLAPLLMLNPFGSLKTLREQGITILLVEQNVHMALQISDYVHVIAEGRVTRSGEARQLAKQEKIRTAYLGL